MTGVSKKYGGVTAVADLSLEIEQGEIVALLGPSGCGKTTTLRCLAGLEDIDAGEIRIAGKLVATQSRSTPPHQRNIGFVFQSYALWPHMTVLKNVAYGLRRSGLARGERERRAEEVLTMVGLDGLGSRTPGELSGGQQQRVALARSLVVRPAVLLLDEPLSNLDSALRNRMRRDLRGILKEVGITSIFVTHDQREAFGICDRVALMDAGHLIQVGSPQALYESPNSQQAASLLGASNLVPVAEVRAAGDDSATGIAPGAVLLRGRPGDEVPDGSAGTAIFRPESALVLERPTGSPENEWSGTVVSRVYEGSGVELTLRSNEWEYRVWSSSAASVKEGDEVWVTVPSHALLIVKADA